jgi:glycosyltransferase involved in cell wall biosynthesis
MAQRLERLHAVHLLNDFSGSPLVFREALLAIKPEYSKLFLYCATPSGNGFLSNLPEVIERPLFYRWSPNIVVTPLLFLIAQLSLLFKLLYHVRKSDTVYVNTLLPFGALLAGKLKGAKVILHVHEVSLKPKLLKSVLVWFAEFCATEVIFVSNYVSEQYRFRKPITRVVFNRLPAEFVKRAEKHIASSVVGNTVLMLCSLKPYKGILEFLEIASVLPNLKFELVLNSSEQEVNKWAAANSVSSNCNLFSSQSNTHPFYQRARVVLNLSRPDEWVETFGMTILEAMSYNLFVIVPPAGGPLELLDQYSKGVALNGRNTEAIAEALQSQFATIPLNQGAKFQFLE